MSLASLFQSEEFLTIAIVGLLLLASIGLYLRSLRRQDQSARRALEEGKLFSSGPQAQHPSIDVSSCIGCQGCTMVCPEGTVLGMVGGKAAFVNPHKCIGHGLCADACPVGAITMVSASPSLRADLPYVSSDYESSVPNLFIVGELGGLALIRNAVNQGRDCVDTIVQRLASSPSNPGTLDLLIVGAGPAGLSASLRAIEKKLRFLTIEREEVGGTVAKYPRQKLVMTSPVDFPLYGKFNKLELSKENLLSFWNDVSRRAGLAIQTRESLEHLEPLPTGAFLVSTHGPNGPASYQARFVILALGRTGTPRKLGIPGEDSPKVMYRLIEADHYTHQHILVVGGGDSAVEAAMGLARQRGNTVTLSYRKSTFQRIKDRNAQRISEMTRAGKLRVLFESNPLEIHPDSVLLETPSGIEQIPNNFVWVFAGGVPPNEFLKKLGIHFGPLDLTVEASREAMLAGSR